MSRPPPRTTLRNYRGEEVHVSKLIENVKAGDILQLPGLFTQMVALPHDYQYLVADLVLSVFREPIPSSSTLRAVRDSNDSLVASPARDVAMTVLMTINFMYLGWLDIVLAEDASGTGEICELFEKTWPKILRWMRFLLANTHIFAARANEPVKTPQSVVSGICQLLCVWCRLKLFREKIMRDPVVFAIVLSAYVKQDVDVLIEMDSEREGLSDPGYPTISKSDAPAYILARILMERTNPQNAELVDGLRILGGKERDVVKIVLQHLHRAVAMSPDTAKPIRKLTAHMFLLDMLTHVKSFMPYILRHKVIAAVVTTLKFALTSLPSDQHTTGSALWSPSVLTTSLSLLIYFFSKPRADLYIRVALSERAEGALAAIAERVHENPTADGPEFQNARPLSFILTQMASYTICRTVADSVVNAVVRAFDSKRGLDNCKLTGGVWSVLQRLAIEHAVCKYLFDESYRRVGYKCNCCRNNYPLDEIKKCGACEVAMYCSRTCQKFAWRLGGHKHECKAMRTCKDERDETEGRNDTLFCAAVAKMDVHRLLPAICDHMKQTKSPLTIQDVLIQLKYSIIPEAPYPIVSYRLLPPDVANTIGATVRRTVPNADTRTDIQIVITQVNVPQGNTDSSTFVPVPISTKWLDVAYDRNHIMRTRRPHLVGDERFRRVQFRLEGVGPEDKSLTPLGALRDDVDDVMLELSCITALHPKWSFAKRLKGAVGTVEERVKKYNRELWDEWI